MDQTLRDRIDQDVKNNKVFLYMKGTPQMPQCGFSAQAVSILNSYHIDFGSFNVLDDDDIRAGIKEYSDWPTIPQLYINGEFIGGCDIITEMHQNNELKSLLG
jgi:monothiol glutaredoxin